MKNVYVFFIATQFRTGKAIRLVTRNKYSHVALSFDPNTQMLYSYARYRYHEPMLSGFGIEYTDRYAAPEYNVDIKVCEVPVTDAHFERIKKRIELYTARQSCTRYNFFDVFAYPFQHHVELEFTHTCISFLLELLEIRDIHTISQLEEQLNDHVVYEGPLRDFENCPSSGPVDFFERRRRREVYAQSILAIAFLASSLMKKFIA